MRTSVGFFDTGTSGNRRIHTRPARFICRVIRPARRFDLPRGDAGRLLRFQSMRAEAQADGARRRSLMRPLWALRYFVRFVAT